MSATLGGLIKDLRLQKNISQLEIAFALGWKEPSRLSRIEQGRNTTPPRFLIENIMNAMKLSDEEKSQLRMLGNYLPEKEEIQEVKANISQKIEEWPYPAACLDYTWRLISTNRKMWNVLGYDKKLKVEIEDKCPNVLELIFDPKFPLNHEDKNSVTDLRKVFLMGILQMFLYEQRTRIRERWFQDLIRKMMNNDIFRELWPKVQTAKAPEIDFHNFGQKSFKTKDTTLNFFFFVSPVFKDKRFFVEFYVPCDIETFQYFNKK